MDFEGFPFAVTAWASIAPVIRQGASGFARSRERQIGQLRFRLVEHSPGYEADHWWLERPCRRSYEVADEVQPHRPATKAGAKLIIVD
jgi:hypothetical protein